MSSIYKRKRNGKNDGYVMYSIYAYDPLKNKKRYFNITLGKLGPTLTWNDCLKQQKELNRVFDIKKGGKKELTLNNAIKTYLQHKKIHFRKIYLIIKKILNLNEFSKYKYLYPKNVDQIYKLDKYVRLKTKSFCINYLK